MGTRGLGGEKTYDENAVAVEPAPGTCGQGIGVKVVDAIVKDEVDPSRSEILLDPLAVLVRV
jgi:hypothetical protein